nr:hypothetical protein [Vibrio sp. 10N.261.51.A7]
METSLHATPYSIWVFHDLALDQAAEQEAKELANPNTAYASLNLKLQYSGGYDGGGDAFATVLQPTLPFPMDNGDKVIFRPAISYVQNDFHVDTPASSQRMDQSGLQTSHLI